jgi:hypothetical protein
MVCEILSQLYLTEESLNFQLENFYHINECIKLYESYQHECNPLEPVLLAEDFDSSEEVIICLNKDGKLTY